MAPQGLDIPGPDDPVNVRVDRIAYDEDRHLSKYERSIALVKDVLNSAQFQAAVLEGPASQEWVVREDESETAACSSGGRSSYSWNILGPECLDNAAVLERIVEGDWTLSLQVETRWYDFWCGKPWIGEVGHREGDTIVTQECQLERMSDEALAGHIIHEQLHVIGFDHPYRRYPNRPNTVPYYVGSEAERILRERLRTATVR